MFIQSKNRLSLVRSVVNAIGFTSWIDALAIVAVLAGQGFPTRSLLAVGFQKHSLPSCETFVHQCVGWRGLSSLCQPWL